MSLNCELIKLKPACWLKFTHNQSRGLSEKFADKVIYGKITRFYVGLHVLLNDYQLKKSAKHYMIFYIFLKYTPSFTFCELELQSTISFFHDVR